MEAGANTCFWNGVEFPEGAQVESEGVSFECGFGRWVQNS